MLQPIIKNTYLIEVNMPTVTIGQRYTFLDVAQVRYPEIFLQGIEAYNVSMLSKSPNGANIVTAAGATGIVVTLAVKDYEDIYQMPYVSLVAGLNAGLIREFANKQIVLTKSYITILDATNLTAGESAIFNFYYHKI